MKVKYFVELSVIFYEAYQGGVWCRFVACFPLYLSPIW